jgi:predicted nucleic acid-binding protein
MSVLVDAGAIVALFDRRQAAHERCFRVFHALDEPLVTCEAVIAEACHLLRHLGNARFDLLADVEAVHYLVHYSLAERAGHVVRLMKKYSNVPMDLADACLVDLADLLQTGRILTLDADFHVYRWGRNRRFESLLEE